MCGEEPEKFQICSVLRSAAKEWTMTMRSHKHKNMAKKITPEIWVKQ